MPNVTANQLATITETRVVGDIAGALETAITVAELDNALRISHFVAQVAHESARFSTFTENLNYSPDRAAVVFRGRADERSIRLAALDGRQALANLVYGGEWGYGNLGNIEPGDGWRYRGRGAIMLTGRANYLDFSEWVDQTMVGAPDLFAQPDLVATPRWGMLAAAWFWSTRGLNSHADRDDLMQITRRINGGTNGIDDRRHLLERAKRVLGPTWWGRDDLMPTPPATEADPDTVTARGRVDKVLVHMPMFDEPMLMSGEIIYNIRPTEDGGTKLDIRFADLPGDDDGE